MREPSRARVRLDVFEGCCEGFIKLLGTLAQIAIVSASLWLLMSHGLPVEPAAFAPTPELAYALQTPFASETKAESADQLKQLGIVLRMFANESRGEVFPSLDSRPGNLMMRASEIFPEYVVDTSVFVSPAYPDAARLKEQAAQKPLSLIDDRSYWYLGYAILNEDRGLSFIEGYRKAVEEEGVPTDDLKASGGAIYRLREGVERILISDINNPDAAAQVRSRIPVMIERPELEGGGSNVLFLDGRVVFMKYPGPFPMTKKFIEALKSLDELKP